MILLRENSLVLRSQLFWGRPEVVLGSAWGRSGVIMESFWGRSGVVLRFFWICFRIILKSCWDHAGVVESF